MVQQNRLRGSKGKNERQKNRITQRSSHRKSLPRAKQTRDGHGAQFRVSHTKGFRGVSQGAKVTAYDLWKFHDDREDFDNNHCPHGESWDDPCDECEAENE